MTAFEDYLIELSGNCAVREARTPNEMRSEIYRLQHYDHLVRSVMDAANYGGMTSEDSYTFLAYHALREKQAAQNLLLENFRTSVSAPIIVDPAILRDIGNGK